MIDPTTRLLEVYRQELATYREVLDLAQQGADSMRQGQPISVLHQINLAKKERLDGIRALESSVTVEKESWRRRGRFGDGSRELDSVLGEITRLIEEILDHERETDRWILHGAGMTQPNLAIA